MEWEGEANNAMALKETKSNEEPLTGADTYLYGLLRYGLSMAMTP